MEKGKRMEVKISKNFEKILGSKEGQKQFVDIILNYDVRERFEGDEGIIDIGSEKFKIIRISPHLFEQVKGKKL